MVVKEIYHELGPFKLFSWAEPDLRVALAHAIF
jgi:hypothetical protein